MREFGTVRAIDGGGNGFRRADVTHDSKIIGLTESGPFGTVSELIRFALADLPSDSLGVSYAIAGIIKNRRCMVRSPNIKFFDNTPLGEMTTKFSATPTLLCNDMESSVVGMSQLVQAVRGKRFIGITVSSGIGARFADEKGQPIFQDCEAGHIQIDPSPNAPMCGCGNRGCVEALAGGEAVRRRVVAETQVRGIKIPDGMHPCAFLDQEFETRQPWAVSIYRIAINGLGDLLAILSLVTHIQDVVWKGTFAKKLVPKIDEAIRQRMSEKMIDPSWAREIKFHFSPDVDGINNSDSFIGAAHLLRAIL